MRTGCIHCIACQRQIMCLASTLINSKLISHPNWTRFSWHVHQFHAWIFWYSMTISTSLEIWFDKDVLIVYTDKTMWNVALPQGVARGRSRGTRKWWRCPWARVRVCLRWNHERAPALFGKEGQQPDCGREVGVQMNIGLIGERPSCYIQFAVAWVYDAVGLSR
jgi:hypothetical protein